jgi:hypothetical protein
VAHSRWRSTFGNRPVPRDEGGLTAFVASVQQTPQTAHDLANAWTALGELDQARAVIDRMPSATPRERFDQVAARWLVDFVAGTQEHVEALEVAAYTIEDPGDRAAAEVEIAVDRARIELAAGRDWRVPLAFARPRLGRAPAGPFRRVIWWPSFRTMTVGALIGAAVFWLAITTWDRL